MNFVANNNNCDLKNYIKFLINVGERLQLGKGCSWGKVAAGERFSNPHFLRCFFRLESSVDKFSELL